MFLAGIVSKYFLNICETSNANFTAYYDNCQQFIHVDDLESSMNSLMLNEQQN